MPPEALNALNVEEQAARWRDVFRGEASDDASAVFLALGEGEQPCGFGACGRQRGPRLAEAGFPVEFSALYLSRRAQRRGIGRALMGVMAEHLIAKGFSSASVWVFRDNPAARRFTRRSGRKEPGLTANGPFSASRCPTCPMAGGIFQSSPLARPRGIRGIDVYGRRRKLPSLLAGRTRLGRSDHAGYRHNR